MVVINAYMKPLFTMLQSYFDYAFKEHVKQSSIRPDVISKF